MDTFQCRFLMEKMMDSPVNFVGVANIVVRQTTAFLLGIPSGKHTKNH